MEIAEFLLARIAEDEDWVRQCGDDFAPASQPDNSTRVLAKCEADRRIVEEVADWGRTGNTTLRLCEERTLRLLALPYADHPDYDLEWKP